MCSINCASETHGQIMRTRKESKRAGKKLMKKFFPAHFSRLFRAGSHVRRKRKRMRKQNEIHMRISVSQDGGNLVPRVCVTLYQQSWNEDSGNELKDGRGGRHLGLSLNRKCMEQLFFYLAFAFALAFPQFTRVKCKRKRKKMKMCPFLALALDLAFAFVLW